MKHENLYQGTMKRFGDLVSFSGDLVSLSGDLVSLSGDLVSFIW